MVSGAGLQRTKSVGWDAATEGSQGGAPKLRGLYMISRLLTCPSISSFICPYIYSSFTQALTQFIHYPLICFLNEETFIEHLVCART